MAHDPQMRLAAQDGLAMVAKITLKAQAMFLHKRPNGDVNQLWRLIIAVPILFDQKLVALPILTVRGANIPVSVDDPPARLDGTNGSFLWKAIFFGGLVTLALRQKEPVRTLALLQKRARASSSRWNGAKE